MKVTPWPTKTRSSIVTPSQMKLWLEILHRSPTLAFFWISTKAPIFVSSPISQPYRLMNDASLTSRPSLTSGAMHRYWLMPTPVSTRTLARDDGRRRGKENLDVGPEGTPPGVAEVEAYHLVEGGTASARDLPESGDSRLGFDESPPVPELVLDELVRKRGAWPDQRHLAAKYVPQLRQLVEAGLSEKTADRRHPRIPGQLEQRRAGRVDLAARPDEPAHELLVQLGIGVHLHRPKLEHREPFHHVPDPRLPEKDGPRRSEGHEDGDQREQRGQRHQQEQTAHEIDGALDAVVVPASPTACAQLGIEDG